MLDSDNRPWGRWEEYLNETGYRVKRIIVNPGKRLSLQKHQHRSEHWVIAHGSGYFTLNDTARSIAAGDALFIPQGAIHRVQNVGNDDLIIIETQLGLCLEDDIIRLEDDWNRK
jgi:mannose-6-phosphate isomerase-like protein (cupin superfamily)